MDVTNQILNQTRIQGGSDNTNPATIAAAKVLNYTIGANAIQAEKYKITSVPWVIPFRDAAVGLGVDNFYVKFKLDVDEPRFACFEPPGWECARFARSHYDPQSDYAEAVLNEQADTGDDNSCGHDTVCINTYEPAADGDSSFYARSNPRLSIRVINKGTGNMYIDKDFDVNLLKKSRRPIQEDTLWCTLNDEFYVAFHARNTKQIPYDVDLIIGEQVINEEDIPKPAALNEEY